ncbi:hypothetical protein OPQ81_011920 [Rhizoctonia solani]|nr:hypothetical protein OPQ81_011920 [Rhizoctonia solani]
MSRIEAKPRQKNSLDPCNRLRMLNSEASIPTANEMQTAYRAEIERRLHQLGWTREDMDFPSWSPQRAEWLKLVEPRTPKEMNDEVWNELNPELVFLLEAYRESRLNKERDERRIDRLDCLPQLLSTLERQTPPLISFEIGEYGNPRSSRTRTVTQELAFPDMVDTLRWPVVKSLLEADTTADEFEQAFYSHRAEIDALVVEWRNKLHKRMVDTIPRPDGDILRPVLTINNSNPFQDLPDETKLLLRADSLFLISSSSTRALTYKDILHLTRSDSYSLMNLGIIRPEKPLDIESISNFPLARGAAQALLKSMGCPDASYLELEGQWVCGRCHDPEPRTWTQMVEHYVQEQLLYFDVRADIRRMNIVYHELHNPDLFTDRPMIKYMSTTVLDEEFAQLRGQVRQCKICAKSPIRRDVRGREGKVLKHLLDAHDIRDPKFREHYGNPVSAATKNSLVGSNARELFEDEISDDGSEFYDYAEYDMF